MKKDLKKYLAKIGRRGGKVKSAAKSAACAKNGKLGGRPATRKTCAHKTPVGEPCLLCALARRRDV